MSVVCVNSIKSRLRIFSRKFIDDSIVVVTLSIAFCLLAGALLMMLLSSCTGQPDDKKKVTQMMAVESLRLLSDNPESLRIIAFSDVDSVFGNNFFSEDELMGILDNLYGFSSDIVDGSLELTSCDPKKAARWERCMRLSSIVPELLNASDNLSDEMNGWKVRVLYETIDQFNDTLKSERYFIFDKERKHILHSFEIPIL